MIKEWFFKRYQQRCASVHNTTPYWGKIQQIALVCWTGNVPDTTSKDAVEPVAQALRAAGKQVDIFTLPNKEQISRLTECPDKSLLQAIGQKHYDLLMDVSTASSLTMHYITTSIRADFAAGCSLTQIPYDLTIQVNEDVTPMFIYEQIAKYIHMFFDAKRPS